MGFMGGLGRLMGSASAGAVAVSGAATLASGETQALALDFTDSFFQTTTGFYGSAYVLDTGTPANNYNSSPTQTASSLLTYTSPSLKMTMGPSGTLRFGAHNLVLQSEALDTTWLAYQCSVTANATQNYAGATTAEKLTENSSAGSHLVYQTVTVAAGNYRTYVDFKAAERSFAAITVVVTGGGRYCAVFSLTDGSTTSTNNGSATGVGNGSENLGNGWFRCYVDILAGAGSFTVQPAIASTGTPSFTSSEPVYTGDGVSGIYATRVQVCRTPSDSTYLATTSAARYALPYEWDSAGNLLGILVEEARTNLATYSNDFSNAAWKALNSTTVSANAVASPSGETDADKIVTPSATNTFGVYRAVTSSTAVHTLSVYAKAAGKNYLYVGGNHGSGYVYSYFDLSNGTVAATGAGHTSTIQSCGNGWYRCIVVTVSWSDILRESYFGPTDSASSTSCTGNGTDGVYLWGAQLEAGSFPTSYIPTLGSTVTRAEDNLTSATSTFPWSATAGSVIVSGTAAAASGTQVITQIDDGTESERIRIVRDSSNNLRFIVTDGGVEQCNINLGAVADGSAFRVAAAWSANDFAASLNGGTSLTDGSGTLPTCTTLRYGRGATANSQIRGRLKQFKYVPRRISNADLAVESAP